MNSWGRYPFVRIIIPFISGILLYILYKIDLGIDWLYAVLVFAIAIHLLLRLRIIKYYKFILPAGITYQIIIFLAANHLAFSSADLNNEINYTKFISDSKYAIVKISEPLSPKEKTSSAAVSIEYLYNNSIWKKVSGKSIVYFKNDSLPIKVGYGDFILLKNNFHEIPSPKNPDEFDYKTYLSYKEIYQTAFVKNGEWSKLNYSQQEPIWRFTFWLREKSLEAFEKFISFGRERAVADALIIGDRENMSLALIQSYTSAGVIHVLAVSGLHVAILYKLLDLLTLFIRRKRNGKYYQAIIILSIIWLFCLLTGLSGSVIRAGTMFTFITFGKTLRRTINIFNVLAASALTILLFNPMLIMDVGFQLSYTAVLGITTLYQYINQWLLRENKIIDEAWKISAVSLSAQTATLPITSFYFNQFPCYFIIANLLVIPLSGIILQIGLVLIIFQALPVIAPIIGKVLNWSLYLLDEYIIWIQQLPFSVIHFPKIPIATALLSGIFIICLSRFFITRIKTMLFTSLLFLLLLVTVQSISVIKNMNASSFTIYNFKGKTCFEFREKGNATLVTSDMQLNSEEDLYLKKHYQLRSMNLIDSINIASNLSSNFVNNYSMLLNNRYVQFKNFKMVVLNKNISANKTEKKIYADAILISGNPFIKIEDLLSNFNTKLLIFDASDSKNRINYWKKEANKFHVNYYSTQDSGAYIAQL